MNSIATYLQIFVVTWEEHLVYRLNFVMWRVRMVMQLLVLYFLWHAIFQNREGFFGYEQSEILTYILLGSFVRTIVLSTKTVEVGSIIHMGDLSNYLLKPVSFFSFYAVRDVADKAMNILFAVVEIALVVFLFKPDLVMQTDSVVLLLTGITLGLGIVLYFVFSLIIGFIGFWTPDVWAPRFLTFVIIEFFSGGLFPLDILPSGLFHVARYLPFSYFIYYPTKVYLGQLSISQTVEIIGIGVLWTVGLWVMAQAIWRYGLRTYTAEGR